MSVSPVTLATVPASALRDWVAAILRSIGVAPAGADTAATVLVDANLTGIDTHGVSRLGPYVGLLRGGHVNTSPGYTCEERSGAILFDADRGLGQAAGVAALDEAISRAATRAIIGMTISRIGHLGALGFFTGRAAEKGLVAVLLQNGPPIMGLPGSLRPAIGNNPFSFAAPVRGGPPLVFDVATSEAAFGKVIEAARAGRPIPDGWALDATGRPTLDAKAALRGTLLPAGGHKGIGMSMLIEVLAGGLTGMVPRQAKPEGSGMPAYFGAFLLLANPDLLLGRAAFDDHLADWMALYKGAAPGGRYPGERLATMRAERTANGVPLGPELVGELRGLGESCGMPFPAPLA